MQNGGFFAFFGCTNDAVQVIIGPTRQHFSRFTLGEIKRRIGNPVSGKFRVDL
ncbi:hypothetical protein MJK72_04715 [Klebsiella pneumoniae]|nr:hypothetical protein MJK72_04715 [Klebsiella pneumoniae]